MNMFCLYLSHVEKVNANQKMVIANRVVDRFCEDLSCITLVFGVLPSNIIFMMSVKLHQLV